MFRIELFGGTRVVTDDRTIETPGLGGVKPRQILEILACTPGTPMAKEQLADILWDGAPPPSWMGTLESYVCVLRRSLGRGAGRRSAVSTVMRGYVLDADSVEVDLATFRALRAEAASAAPEVALDLLSRAVTLVRGELFPHEPYAPWAVHERTLVTAEVVDAATTAAGHALELGHHDRAVQLARTAVERDPLAEGAWRTLMTALWHDGRRGEALRAYADLRDVLASELGADPDEKSRTLYLQLLRDGGGIAQAPDHREEIRMLLELLRDAVGSVPGLSLPHGDRALVAVAAAMSGAA